MCLLNYQISKNLSQIHFSNFYCIFLNPNYFFTAVPDDLVTNYTGGIYYDTTGNVEIEHDISVVGYGHDEATGWDYWIIRNSWGTYWVRLLYDRGNTCLFVCNRGDTDSITAVSNQGS